MLYLSSLKANAGEILFERGQYPNTVYFILKGRVGLIEGSDKVVFKSFVPGGYFGEIEIFAKSLRSVCSMIIPNLPITSRSTTAQALSSCEFLTINRHEFEMILRNFPDIKKSLVAVSQEKQNRIKENLKNVISR